ncbi:MAG: DUF6411 family protein [Thermoleophilaceae bacterium]|jgi:hypothetical protein
MFIASVAAICVLLLILAFVAPRLSRGPQRMVNRGFGAGARGASHAPGPLGRWLPKPFRKSSQAANTSASTGRNARSKLPL